MISEEQKEKNIRDLEYNYLLNKENIALVLIGTAIISVILTEELPVSIPKINVLIFLLIFGVGSLAYFSKKLENKAKEIRSL